MHRSLPAADTEFVHSLFPRLALVSLCLCTSSAATAAIPLSKSAASLLLMLFCTQIPFDLIRCNQHFKVHFFRSPDGKWLSLLNFRVVFNQSPDFEDVETTTQKTSEADRFLDFDDEDDWTVIELEPFGEKVSRVYVETGKGRTGAQRQGKVEQMEQMEEGLAEAERKEEEPKREEEKEREEEQEEEGPKIPSSDQELAFFKDLLLLPWIPHKIRHHHKPRTRAPQTAAQTTSPKTTTTTTAVPTTATTKAYYPNLADILIFGGILTPPPETEKEEEPKNATTLLESSGSNETSFVSLPEPINEEELALNLHKDSLRREEAVLRVLLKNITQTTDTGATSAEFHRDLGGSFILPLLKERKYDNRSIPLVFPDMPLQVAVSLEILHLGNFDNFQMEYELDVMFRLRWVDVRLANNFTKSVRLREQRNIDRIWKPDAMFLNSKFSFFHIVSFPNFRMRIDPDGHVTYTSRVTLLPDCQMNFCNFPHDTQRCGLYISSIAHPKSMLNLRWDTQPIVFARNLSLPDFQITRISNTKCLLPGKLIPSACLALTFVLNRDSARYVAERYMPSTLAMIFSWVAPYVPYNYEEVRIITPITVLLTLVQMEKGNQEVITSYLTSLDIWFIVIKAFTVLSLIESLVVMAMIKRGRAVEIQAQRAPNEYRKELLQAEVQRIVRIYHRLDAFSRVLSPVAFMLFLLYYVNFVAQSDGRACRARQ